MKHQDVRSALIPALLIVAVSGCLKKNVDSARSGEGGLTAKLGESLDASPSPDGKPVVPIEDPSDATQELAATPAAAAPIEFVDFVIGGDGPGSCGLPANSSNNCREGRAGISCPDGYRQVAAIGDCYVTPGFGPQCFGNRPLCVRSGADVRPVTGFHLFDGSACPGGWEPATVPSQPQGHRIGISTGPNTDPNAYREVVWCKQTKEVAALIAGEAVLKNVGILGIDQHGAAPACPGGHIDAGGFPDCTNGSRNPNYQWCVGMVRVCKAFDQP